jgi:hypothetical protein
MVTTCFNLGAFRTIFTPACYSLKFEQPAMEPDVKKFLTIIMQCISIIVLWMLVHTFFGIKLGLLFLDEEITIWHGVYYGGLLLSFWLVFRYVMRKIKSMPSFHPHQ